MKRLIMTLLALVVTISTLNAQITEGHVSYKIDATTDNPDMQMAIGMMQGSTMDVYFKDKSTRSEMKTGTIMTVITITNETSDEALMLMSGMMGNKAIKTKVSEMTAKSEEMPQFEVELVNESKEILGYSCKKAILTDESGTETTFWYTQDFTVSTKGQNAFNDKIPGYPMQYEIIRNDMKMTMTVTAVEMKLDKKKAGDLFQMTIPEGYTEMTAEELKAMGM